MAPAPRYSVAGGAGVYPNRNEPKENPVTTYPTRAAARRARNRARRIRRFTVTAVGAAVLALLTTGAAGPASVNATPTAQPVTLPAPVLQEDDPGWNCRTMGNRTCSAPDPTTGVRYLIRFTDDGNTVVSVTPAPPAAQPGRPFEDVTGPDGTVHTDCRLFVGDTSTVACADGYTEES